jgi:ankyrin repeat protein
MPKEMESEQKAGQAASTSQSVAEINANLWNACRNGILSSNDANVMSVQAAIAAGADVNYSSGGTSCLAVAVIQGHHEIVGHLITAGVDKEAKLMHDFTALIIAAQVGGEKCAGLLLTAGANTEAKNVEGITALIIAAEEGKGKCVERLLTAGANKEAKTQNGCTALIFAADKGH